MLAICTYSLSHYTASEVLEVSVNHQFTLFRRGDTLRLGKAMGGDWLSRLPQKCP